MKTKKIAMQSFVVTNAAGLHLRCVSLLAKAAMRFEAAVSVESQGRMADGKSVMQLLTLGAPRGAVVTINAAGHDAAEALRTIAMLFDAAFHEHEGTTLQSLGGAG